MDKYKVIFYAGKLFLYKNNFDASSLDVDYLLKLDDKTQEVAVKDGTGAGLIITDAIRNNDRVEQLPDMTLRKAKKYLPLYIDLEDYSELVMDAVNSNLPKKNRKETVRMINERLSHDPRGLLLKLLQKRFDSTMIKTLKENGAIDLDGALKISLKHYDALRFFASFTQW